MTTIKANKDNYGERRSRASVKYIVIHYTANKGDTAAGNGNYFQRNVTRSSAHFFVDRAGNVVKSVALDHVAWAVGGAKWHNNGGKLYGKASNLNSVSIELCDIVDKDPSEAQTQAVRNTIRYIRKYCPNAKYLIRHYDVNGKPCPKRYINESKWEALYERLAVVGITKG